MEQALGGREQQLMSTVPAILARRFEELRKNQTAAGCGASPPHQPASQQAAETWQLVFGQELQALLLAELDDRLQPVAGMVDAFKNLQPPQLQ
jgi:Protein of unknown function (DUF3348)